MALPSIYQDAALRNVTRCCGGRARFGVGFDVAGAAAPVRVALSLADARFLADELAGYLALAAGVQSPTSSLMPSAAVSVPSEGENV